MAKINPKKIKNVKIVKSLKDKTLGLIGKKEDLLFFKTHFGIHTFFMSSSIDVVILDKQNRIVLLRNSLKPNRIFLWNPKFSKVLEMPEGSSKKFHLKKGDVLKIN